jgi:predicted RNase H-like HicB family nuclease
MREFTVILDPDTEEGGYTVTVPALPGCITEGDTREQALANAREAIALYTESLLKDGELIADYVPGVEVGKVAVNA